MDIKQQVKIWVENKFEKVIIDDLKDKIVEENSQFNVEDYVNSLFSKYLYKKDIKNLKKSLTEDSYDLLDFESEISAEERNNLNDTLELGSTEFQKFSIEKLIKNLESGSTEVIQKSLQDLETSVQDLISQNSWNKIEEALRNILNKVRNREIQNLVIKVFWMLLKWHKRPQISSKVFASVAKLMTDQIDQFNLENWNISFEEIYDIKEQKWYSKKKSTGFEHLECSEQMDQRFVNPEILIKMMWLLIDYQHNIRVNETKYQEIIFSFIQLLNSTTTSKNTMLSGLEIVSVLSPRASWCYSWCHTAVGRSLLCAALRKYKNFFVQIIEVVLNHVKIRKASVGNDVGFNKNLPTLGNDILKPSDINNEHTNNQTKKEKTLQKIKHSSDGNNSNIPSALTKGTRNNYTICGNMNKNTKWIIECIPRTIVKEAVFFHCISFVSRLIKYRSGRALFPVQIAKSKRLLTVQDFSLSISKYLETINYYKWNSSDVAITAAYQNTALEILDVLKTVSTHMNSFRTSAKKPFFSNF